MEKIRRLSCGAGGTMRPGGCRGVGQLTTGPKGSIALRLARLAVLALAILPPTSVLALADSLSAGPCNNPTLPGDFNCYLHHIVYINETGTAYYLTQNKHGFSKPGIPHGLLGGVPTFEYDVGIARRAVTTGQILLRDPVTQGAESSSDLIRFVQGGADPNCNAAKFQYCLQFYSDVDPNPLFADVGLPSFSLSGTTVEYEEDLTDVTKNWRCCNPNGVGDLDPNSTLNLKGLRGFAYVAFLGDTGNVPAESPVGYIFVSDDTVVPGPEPSSLVLFATLIIAGALYMSRYKPIRPALPRGVHSTT